jgi:hypothetical protein
VPYRSVVIGLDVRAAIAASLIGVVATSSGAAIVLVNLLAALFFGPV